MLNVINNNQDNVKIEKNIFLYIHLLKTNSTCKYE